MNETITLPGLTGRVAGRVARCGLCGAPEPSDREKLAFFEYCGPGSSNADDRCECGYAAIAHLDVVEINPHTGRRNEVRCGQFSPRGDGPDRYYCGCRGWD